MLNLTLLAGFIPVAMLILIIPGPGVVYVVARSLGQGYRAGFASAAGLSAGVLVHVFAAAVGLSAIIYASSLAFTVVKYIGAAYLIYLGIQALRSTIGITHDPIGRALSLRRLFTDGVLVSAFNPKIALFFLAFLPQFVDPQIGNVTMQIVLLGLIYAVLAFLTDSTYGVLAVSAQRGVKRHVVSRLPLKYLTGPMLIGLGIKTALSERP